MGVNTLTLRRAVLAAAGALLLATLAAGCDNDDPAVGPIGPSTAAGSNPLDGRTFLSLELLIAADARGHSIVAGSQVSLSFRAGSVSAHAGCNTLSGDYELVDNVLVIKTLAMTEIGCPKQLHEQDEWLAGFLTSEPSWFLEQDRLRLTSGPESLLLLDRETAHPDQSLTDTPWLLDSLIADDAVSSVPQGVQVDVRFIDDGDGELVMQGSAGCNRFTGAATLSGEGSSGVLDIGALATTRKACVGAAADVEAQVLAVLTGQVEYQIDAAQLTLSSGEKGLTYRARQ
jgi:heat shock protein HslJ